MRTLPLALLVTCLSFAADLPRAATTTVALTINGVGTLSLTPTGGVLASLTGTGTAGSLGSFTFTGSGEVQNLLGTMASTLVPGTLVFAFPNGDKLNSTISIPAGAVAPGLVGSTTATGTGTITGGTGQFAGATGTLSSLLGGVVESGFQTGSFKVTGSATVITVDAKIPVISAKGVVTASAYGAYADVAAGTWIEIYGTNLSATTRGWGGSDFTNNGQNAPTSLDGVKVTVGGQPAFINYVSLNQVNALVPSNAATGPSQLTLTNTFGISTPYSIMIKPAAPGLLAPASLLLGGKQYLGGLTPDGKAFAGVPANPAKAGDTLIVYGIGFGPVTPAINAGTIAAGLTSLVTKPQFLFGTTPADLAYFGLTPGLTGLYQFNVVVPDMGTNMGMNMALPLTVNLGGVAVAQTLFIAVQ